jgi:predicted MFS family arabinose efflux permease
MTAVTVPQTPRRAYAGNVRWFYAFKFFSSFALWSPIWVLYLQEQRGFSLAQITALDAPFWLVMILAEIPTGVVADRWGRRLSLLIGAGFYALAILIFGLAASYPVILLSYLAWALSMTLISGADSAFIYDSLLADGRADDFPRILGRMYAIDSAAFLLGALVGAPLAAATALNVPILVTGAISVLAAVMALSFREPPRHNQAEQLPYFRIMGEGLRYTLAHPSLRAMIALRAVVMTSGMAGIIFIQPFLRSFDVPVKDFGWLTTPISLAAIGGALIAHRLVARLGERTVVFALSAGFIIALFILGLVNAFGAFAAFALLRFSNATFSVVSSDNINQRSPSHLRATVMSVGQMAFSLLIAIAEPAAGLLADRTSLQTTFLVSAVVGAVLTSVALIAWTAACRKDEG